MEGERQPEVPLVSLSAAGVRRKLLKTTGALEKCHAKVEQVILEKNLQELSLPTIRQSKLLYSSQTNLTFSLREQVGLNFIWGFSG